MDNPTSNNAAIQKALAVQKIAHKGDLRSIINAKCCDCIYDPEKPGNWREQVGDCIESNCPLYGRRRNAQAKKQHQSQTLNQK